MIRALALTAMIGLLSPLASAERAEGLFGEIGFYVGAGGGSIAVDAVDAFEKDVNFRAVEVLGGVGWRWFGLETRQGFSLEDEPIYLGPDSETGIPEIARTSIDNYSSTYLRIRFENDIAHLYGLLGRSEVSTTTTFRDSSFNKATASGNSYGMGAGVYISPRMNFNLELKYLLKTDDNAFLMTSFSVDFRI